MSEGEPNERLLKALPGVGIRPSVAHVSVRLSTDFKKKRLYKILLVSSPYNMRRASLVFNNIAKEIDVVYMPVLNSQFYRQGWRVKLEQIRAIMHEYLGIIFYWWKGYI